MVLLVRRAEPGDQRSLTSLVSKAGGPTKVIMYPATCAASSFLVGTYLVRARHKHKVLVYTANFVQQYCGVTPYYGC